MIDEKHTKRLAEVAKGASGKFMLEYLEYVKQSVADVRNPLNVNPEIEKEVRLGICEKIDELLVTPLRTYGTDYIKPNDSWE